MRFSPQFHKCLSKIKVWCDCAKPHSASVIQGSLDTWTQVVPPRTHCSHQESDLTRPPVTLALLFWQSHWGQAQGASQRLAFQWLENRSPGVSLQSTFFVWNLYSPRCLPGSNEFTTNWGRMSSARGNPWTKPMMEKRNKKPTSEGVGEAFYRLKQGQEIGSKSHMRTFRDIPPLYQWCDLQCVFFLYFPLDSGLLYNM